MTDTQSTTEPTIAEIKDALRYAIKVALAGKLELSVPESHIVMQNLANCEAIAKGLSDNAVIFTPPLPDPVVASVLVQPPADSDDS